MVIWNANGFNSAWVRSIFNKKLSSIIIAGFTTLTVLMFASLIMFSNIAASDAQVNTATKPIEVDLFVDGLNLLRPEDFLETSLKSGQKTDLIIDNKPSGLMTIKSVKQLPITINVTQPDGSVKELPDPSAKFQTDIFITLTGKAQIQNTGAVLGESLVKIGSPAKIEGFNYDINATVADLRTK
ncbi:hypothetical protein NIES267_34580 [Calothrix parasitica NIES-267]|uniref:DUF4330 domain-containing protein n=1 Tax=Calothrix parasitica NIES-267 TaxID=1973488 RepID=A0A1Z4LS14_9CYAN|nr:hypothetical protein NIES267_34580 [Calothrix parasitica NIES-267]